MVSSVSTSSPRISSFYSNPSFKIVLKKAIITSTKTNNQFTINSSWGHKQEAIWPKPQKKKKKKS